MANVRGFRDLNNQNQPRRNNNAAPAANVPLGNMNDDQIPFISTMKSNRTPMEETIPYTLKLICCPDLKCLSTTIIFLLAIWVMYILCLCQGIEQSNQRVLQVQYSTLLDFGGALGNLIKSGEVYRLVTAAFLHVDLMHIIMNSVSLLFLCTRLQKIYKLQTPFILLISSVTGFMLSVLCNQNTLTVGASAAIFGVLGAFVAFLIMNWTTLGRFGPIRSTIACLVGFLVFISLLFSIGETIDLLAHLGGLLGGLFSSFAILPTIEPKNKIFTYVGIVTIVGMNLTTFLMLFLTN